MTTFDIVAKNSEWKEEVKESIWKNTLNLFSKINYITKLVSNPIGLMVGKIQSGKTGNLIGAAAHALDQGYKLVIIYLSDQYALYEQNLERLKVSFKVNDDSIQFIDNSKISEELSIYEKSPEDINYHLSLGRTFIICTLKNPKRISDISDIFSQSRIVKEKVMIIDDEGDDISQNTHGSKHKKTPPIERKYSPNNREIVKLMKSFENYVYISVTATPQAPLLIYKFEELSPNFVSLVYPGSEYSGLETFHSEAYPYLTKVIDDHKILLEKQHGIPESLKKAFAYFFLGGTIRLKNNPQDQIFRHSFLIHLDKLIIKQNDNFNRLQSYFEKLKSEFLVGKGTELSFFVKLTKDIILEENNRNPFTIQYSDSLMSEIFSVIKETKLVVLNGSQEVKNLKKTVQGRRFFIVIGGDMLDRGLTIEGLAVSYFTRSGKKSQVDTLLQRARWYGYKMNYINYCRLYAPIDVIEKFEAALIHESSVWDFLEIVENSTIDLRNIQTQFKLDTTLLSPTNSNKGAWNNEGLQVWFTQQYFSINKQDQFKNANLVNELFKNNYNIDNFKSSFESKVKTINFNEFYHFIKSFKFSQLQKKDLISYVDLLTKIHPSFLNINFDLVYLRYQNGEKRKLLTDDSGNRYLSNIMQGRGQETGDYPGDREIIKSNPMLQIHKVILKEPYGTYEIGDEVYTLAFGIPKSYAIEKFITSVNQ